MKPRFFFACGTLAPLIYLGAVALGETTYPGYRPFFQAVSELVAAGAPTKPALDLVFFLCEVLIALFSFGIFLQVRRTHGREARAAASLGSLTLAGISLLGVLVLVFPMDPPGSALSLADYTLTGKIHVGLASLMSAGSLPAVLLIGFWLYQQKAFRALARYSFATGAVLCAAGCTTAVIYFSRSYLLGAFERLTFILFFQWLMVVSWHLFKADSDAREEKLGRDRGEAHLAVEGRRNRAGEVF